MKKFSFDAYDAVIAVGIIALVAMFGFIASLGGWRALGW